MSSSLQLPNVNTLHQEKNKKEDIRSQMFKSVLKLCIEKITSTNTHTDNTFIIFELPRVLIGYPAYDIQLCCNYIIRKLQSHGYSVQQINSNNLYIDWSKPAKNNSDNIPLSILQKLPKKFQKNNIEIVYEDEIKTSKKNKKSSKNNKHK